MTAWLLLAAGLASVVARGRRRLAHSRATARNGTILARPKPAAVRWPGSSW